MSRNVEPVLLNMEEVEAEEVRWLWENRVPIGKVTIFAGDPGLGKSLVSLWMAAQVTRSGGEVVILSAEDDPADTIRPRLDGLGAVVSRVHVLKAVRVTTDDGKQSERMVRLDCDIEQVAEAIRRHPETALVIIDPLSAYMGKIDARSDEQVRSILAPLAELAAKTSVAIVCIKHLNKAEEKAAIYRAGGSIGFVAAARVVWLFAKDRKDSERRVMVLVKSNIGPDLGGKAYQIEQTETGLQLKWESESVRIGLEDVLRPTPPHDGESALDAAERWLLEMLDGGPVAATEVEQAAKEAGLSWATVRRAADDLTIKSGREGFGKEGRWMWSLP